MAGESGKSEVAQRQNVWEKIRGEGRVSRDLETTQRKADRGLEEQQHLDLENQVRLKASSTIQAGLIYY